MFLVGCKTIGIELVTTEQKKSTVCFSIELIIKEEVSIKHGFINSHAITKKYFTTVAKPSGKIMTVGKLLSKGKYTLMFSINTEFYNKEEVLKLVFSTSNGERTLRYKLVD